MSTETPEKPQVLRQHLVDEAAKFLMNPNVASHADDQKSAFLQKKGLTENEIQAAFAKAKSQMPVTGASSGPVVPVGPPVSVPVPAYAMPPPPSMWLRIRDICNFALIITGASYGVYHMYKNYIGPLLTGRRQKSVEESMIELQQSVVAVLKEVQTTLSSLEQTLSAQNVRIQNLSAKEEKGHTSQQLEELKTEITSLKGLLINRRTFPATPGMSPSIPSWQLTKTATEKAVEEPAVSAPTVPTQIQNESVKSEDILVKNGKQNSEEMITDGTSEESGLCINDSNEEDSNPSSSRENGHSAVESLAESAGDSSDEMSQ